MTGDRRQAGRRRMCNGVSLRFPCGFSWVSSDVWLVVQLCREAAPWSVAVREAQAQTFASKPGKPRDYAS
jgi:hypothetical protein